MKIVVAADLTMGARMIVSATMRRVVDAWLATPFAGGRHQRRVQIIQSIVQRYHSEKQP
jgi:ribose 5-phosphate isomerase RpiB